MSKADRRRPKTQVTPAIEDSGVFRNDIISLSVLLLPHVRRTDRRDVVLGGRYRTESDELLPIEVILAGRRAVYAAPLIELINRRLGASASGGRIGVPIHVNGAWRYRYDIGYDGWQNTIRQFMVAQWKPIDATGQARPVGEPAVRSGRTAAAAIRAQR